MSYPRKYGASASGAVEPVDWDAMCDAIAGGVTLDGVRAVPHSYLVRYNSGYWEGVDKNLNLDFGGSSNAGSVDGSDAAAVIQAAYDAMPQGSWLVVQGAYDTDEVLSGDVTSQNLFAAKPALTIDTGLVFDRQFTKVVFDVIRTESNIVPITISEGQIEVYGGYLYREAITTDKPMIQIESLGGAPHVSSHGFLHVSQIFGADGVGIKLTGDVYFWDIDVSYIIGCDIGVHLYATNDGDVIQTCGHNLIKVKEIAGANKACTAVKFEANGTGRVAANTALKVCFQASSGGSFDSDVGFWNNDRNSLVDCQTSDLNDNAKAIINSGQIQCTNCNMEWSKVTNTGTGRLSGCMQTNTFAVNGFAMKTTAETVLSLSNVTASVGKTNLDVSSNTSVFAHTALLNIVITPNTVGSDPYAYVELRPTNSLNTTNTLFLITKNEAIATVPMYMQVMQVLDASKTFDYYVGWSTGWDFDVTISLIGYIES